jgi:hypothetical protein
MTTPAAPTPAPAAPAKPPAGAAVPPASQDRTDALGAAIVAIARHITGDSGDGHQALVMLGLTSQQADAITG